MTEEEDVSEDAVEQPDPEYSSDLFKHWFQGKERGGFLSVDPWFEAGKLKIDVGSTQGSKRLSSTMVWANMIDLYVYLRAVHEGRATTLYPANPKTGIPTAEGFAYYGGSTMESGPVSRIIKIHHWEKADDQFDTSAFAWKTGHFAARKSQTGAYIPDMSKRLSADFIRIPRVKMSELFVRLDIAINAYASAQAVEGKKWWDLKKPSS